MKLEDLKENVVKVLESKGWVDVKIHKKIKESSGTFDVIATSKGVLKKTLLIIVSTDIYDAQIGIMLLDGVPKRYVRVILLESGDPFFIERPKDIKIVTDTNELPNA